MGKIRAYMGKIRSYKRKAGPKWENQVLYEKRWAKTGKL